MPGVNRQARWTRLISKVFDIKGSGPDLQVLDDILPVAPLYDPTDSEHHFGREEYLWSRGTSLAAAGAGNYNTVQAATREGYITVIEGIAAHSDGARAFGWRIDPSASLAGASNLSGRLTDCRYEQISAPGVQMYTYAPAVALTDLNGYTVLSATAPVFVPIGAVLDSDDIIQFQNMAANTALYITIFGYDRRAEMSERG